MRDVQARLGREAAGPMVEEALARTARGLQRPRLHPPAGRWRRDLRRRRAGAGAQSLAIGPEIDPGVPWTRTLDGPDMALALKSGNFGAPDFFLKAWASFRERRRAARADLRRRGLAVPARPDLRIDRQYLGAASGRRLADDADQCLDG